MFTSTGENQIPQGVRDLLPEDAKKRRIIESKLHSVFERWGFQQINTPTFEFFQTFARGISGKIQKDMYKFFDRDGNILALRPEMTTSIARAVSSQLAAMPLPLRLSYLGNVFRYDEPQAGRQREFGQAGIELIGADTSLADAEVIAIAVECLKEVGLRGFVIALGSAEFINGLVEESGLPIEEQESLKGTLASKNLVAYREQLELLSLPAKAKEIFAALPTLHGGKEVIEKAKGFTINERCAEALNKLAEVYEILEMFGVSQVINLDLGIVRDLDYYTGIVFEGYLPGFGFPICGGGRYDNLLSRFGFDAPATGFALGIERILLSLERQNRATVRTGPDFLVVFHPARRREAITKTKSLRGKGFSVELDVLNRTHEEALVYAKHRGIKNIVIIRENGVEENCVNEDACGEKEKIKKLATILSGVH